MRKRLGRMALALAVMLVALTGVAAGVAAVGRSSPAEPQSGYVVTSHSGPVTGGAQASPSPSLSPSPSTSLSPSPPTSHSPSPSTSLSPSHSPSPSPSPTRSTQRPEPHAHQTPMLRARSVRAARRYAVPILVYHHIQAPPQGPSSVTSLYVSPATFARQMAWLHRHGYHPVTLRQLFDFWVHDRAIPRKPIVLTFDDGWRTVYTHAAAVLKHYGWPGVINEVVWAVDTSYGMSRAMLRRLVRRGWEIDSHTVSHPDLSRLSASRLRTEVVDSRRRLERTLHTPVDFFCYPGGSYDNAVIRAVRAAGYKGALSVWGGLGRWNERWTLHRIMATDSSFNVPR